MIGAFHAAARFLRRNRPAPTPTPEEVEPLADLPSVEDLVTGIRIYAEWKGATTLPVRPRDFWQIVALVYQGHHVVVEVRGAGSPAKSIYPQWAAENGVLYLAVSDLDSFQNWLDALTEEGGTLEA